jgi:hypothetical protein
MALRTAAFAASLLVLTDLSAGQSPARPPGGRDVVVVAHRGLSAGFPENTLAAFRNAIDGGVDAIELDLRSTADGEIVVLHDETVDRTTDGRGALARMPLRDLKALDAGRHAGARFAGERVPTYREVLHATQASGLLLLLDIKESDGRAHDRIVSRSAETTDRFQPARDGPVLDRVLARLAALPAIARVIRPTDVAALGYPDSADNPYVPGHYIVAADIDTHLVIDPAGQSTERRLRRRPYHGHGYLPDHPAMHTALVLSGAGIALSLEH